MISSIKRQLYDLKFTSVDDHELDVSSFMQFILTKRRRSFFMMLGGCFLVALLSMLFPLLTGYLIGHMIIQSQVSVIWYFAGLFLSASVLLSCFTLIKSILFSQFQINLMYYIQSLIMRQVFRLPMHFFEHYPAGELNQRLFIMESLSMILHENQFGAFITLICTFSTFGLMMLYAWKLTLFLLLIVGAVFAVSVWSTYQIVPYLETYTDSMSRTHGLIFQMVGGISRIKAFHKEREASHCVSSRYQYDRQAWLGVFKRSVVRFTSFKNLQLMMMLILYVITAFISQPTMSLGQFIVFFSAFMQFIVSFTAFNLNMTSWAHGTITYRRLKPILQTETEWSIPDNALDVSMMSRDIIIKNIDFHYPSQILPVIQNLSCTIPVGQHVAIVGFSGSGKTTLMKLLLGLYVPQKGDILFGDTSIKQINLSKLRQEIGVVLQDSKLFPGTILENIIGHNDGDESEAWEVAQLVGLDKVIKSLPMGMHTVVSQHINLLSGGQKQLILIAKALAHQSKLLIFDEATNSLDNITQQAVLNCINSLKITRISIAHRLSSIKAADTIMVLHEGTIVETGHYEQLIQNKQGFFYQLIKNQLAMID